MSPFGIHGLFEWCCTISHLSGLPKWKNGENGRKISNNTRDVVSNRPKHVCSDDIHRVVWTCIRDYSITSASSPKKTILCTWWVYIFSLSLVTLLIIDFSVTLFLSFVFAFFYSDENKLLSNFCLANPDRTTIEQQSRWFYCVLFSSRFTCCSE